MLVDVTLYFIIINSVLENQPVQVFSYHAGAHEFTFLISYTCGVITNFLLARYAVFSESTVMGRKQFVRFMLIAWIGFFANYSLLRFFVEVRGIDPTLARIGSALSLGVISFYIHKLFTFKIRNQDEP